VRVDLITKIILSKKRAILTTLFVAYILIVLNLTIVRWGFRYDERQLNLIPFVKLITTFKKAGISEFLRLFLGNMGWFFPFGFLLPTIMEKEKRGFTVIFSGFIFSLSIEIIQFFTRKGVAELDDVILNTLGTAVGYLSCMLLFRLLFVKKGYRL